MNSTQALLFFDFVVAVTSHIGSAVFLFDIFFQSFIFQLFDFILTSYHYPLCIVSSVHSDGLPCVGFCVPGVYHSGRSLLVLPLRYAWQVSQEYFLGR